MRGNTGYNFKINKNTQRNNFVPRDYSLVFAVLKIIVITLKKTSLQFLLILYYFWKYNQIFDVKVESGGHTEWGVF